jgi:hypothetical protein
MTTFPRCSCPRSGTGYLCLACLNPDSEISRLRAENEALIRSWNIDAEYRDDVIKAAEAVIADWDRNPEYEPVSGEALRAQISGG